MLDQVFDEGVAVTASHGILCALWLLLKLITEKVLVGARKQFNDSYSVKVGRLDVMPPVSSKLRMSVLRFITDL